MYDTQLLTSIFRDEHITNQFSDDQYIAYMLQVEVALAKVQSRLSIIPETAGEIIAQAAVELQVDIKPLYEGMEKSSIPTIALLRQLRAILPAEIAPYAHWGATSQDIMDTALVMQLRNCIDYVEALMKQVIVNLANMADKHRNTIMAGRTHSQYALPITFGFKVALWIAPLLRHLERLKELKPRLLVLQFGGAVGTLASLKEQGLAVLSALAQELNVGMPMLPWHTQRDNIAEFAGWLSMVTGSLAKMAQDIILLVQSEVAELRESDDVTRGSSSTMPHKQNPIASELIVAAARLNTNLLSNLHLALIQEHERATGAWQMEWVSLPGMLQLTSVTLQRGVLLSQNMIVNAETMAFNVKQSNGLMLAEALSLALAPYIGRNEATGVVRKAAEDVFKQSRHLADIVQERVDVEIDWRVLKDENNYLGSSNDLIDRMLHEVENITQRNFDEQI